MKLKEIKDQSKFCTELMKRVNDDVQKAHEYAYMTLEWVYNAVENMKGEQDEQLDAEA